MVGETRPLYLKRVRTVDRHVIDSIIPTIRRLSRQSVARTDNQSLVPTISRSYRQSVARTDHRSLVPIIGRS
ncbi:hypothetical protein [Microcoleus vaginatus]|uniref:hypothetical protein n=1 Tax=Microcoleus vaginatus TaxID=119532 RepID=UPI0032A8FB54